MAEATPYSRSSGCATTATALSQSSGIGSIAAPFCVLLSLLRYSGNDRRSGMAGSTYRNISCPGGLHHVELWVPDLTRARREWGWLLGQLGYEPFQDWDDGCSWRLGGTYLVVEQSPAMTASDHDRCGPG